MWKGHIRLHRVSVQGCTEGEVLGSSRHILNQRCQFGMLIFFSTMYPKYASEFRAPKVQQKPERQYTYNVRLRRLRETIAVMEKQ